jgi:hypothetical protein
MAKPDLHKFKKDLQNKPADKSNAPPRSIKADDLDGNFTKTTVIPWDGQLREQQYSVQYTKDGTKLLIFPTFPPSSTDTWVLGWRDGRLLWLETEDC